MIEILVFCLCGWILVSLPESFKLLGSLARFTQLVGILMFAAPAVLLFLDIFARIHASWRAKLRGEKREREQAK